MSNATYRQTFNSFSGVDMLVVMGERIIGEVQGLSYTITREKAPLYTMGSADPRSFSRGKRGIAGSMVFLVFDRSALLSTVGQDPNAQYVGNTYEVRDEYRGTPIKDASGASIITGTAGTFGSAAPSTQGDGSSNAVTADKMLAKPQYHDQIMPFNIVVTAANEYGHTASMAIQGVEIMNCGTGMSVDDISIDESCTFVCTSVTPWGNQRFIRGKVINTAGASSMGISGSGVGGIGG